MLSDVVRGAQVEAIKSDFVAVYGDNHDGSIQMPVSVSMPASVRDGVVEASMFYGNSMPKNIVVVSSQIGCRATCDQCEAGAMPYMGEISPQEMYEQSILVLQQAILQGIDIDGKPLKVDIANTGEPLYNSNLVAGLEAIAELGPSFKVCTIFPAGVRDNFDSVARFSKEYNEPVQIQLSLISTDRDHRQRWAGIRLAGFHEIREAGEYWAEQNPEGRKINLSLVLAGAPANGADIKDILPPELFRIRLRNYVPRQRGKKTLETADVVQIDDIARSFEDAGYEVSQLGHPSPTEKRFHTASNSTLAMYLKMVNGEL